VAAHARPDGDLVEEQVPLRGRVLELLRPRDSEALLDEERFDRDEYLPYWADLWPSAIVLARAVAARALRGARTLELGCGLGLPALAAALAGGRVVASDWSADALAFTRANAERNGVEVDCVLCAWSRPQALVARAPWGLVIASDVLYEQRNVDELLAVLPRLVDLRGEVWIADPGRVPAERFLAEAERGWERRTTLEGERPAVSLHRLRRRL
jgi:predicted nicotinamide N-methyase